MSTKFAIRPAARKRPWICKRSPPCLVPLPVPDPLLCTFYLENRNPLHMVPAFAGSMLLHAIGPVHHWEGSWNQAGKWHNVEFDYHPGPLNAQAKSDWWGTAVPDSGPWELLDVLAIPNTYYHSFHVETWPERWLGEITITM